MWGVTCLSRGSSQVSSSPQKMMAFVVTKKERMRLILEEAGPSNLGCSVGPILIQ
mgnify:CR=1 FL=1